MVMQQGRVQAAVCGFVGGGGTDVTVTAEGLISSFNRVRGPRQQQHRIQCERDTHLNQTGKCISGPRLNSLSRAKRTILNLESVAASHDSWRRLLVYNHSCLCGCRDGQCFQHWALDDGKVVHREPTPWLDPRMSIKCWCCLNARDWAGSR